MMDDLDQKLITLLRHNARRSVSDLAIELGMARATIRTRMERLEQSGEIIGYTVILKSDAVGLPVRGIMMIEVEGHSADKVIRSLGGLAEVAAIHNARKQTLFFWEYVAFDVDDLASIRLPSKVFADTPVAT